MTRQERQSTAQLLDRLVPLLGASHTEVVDYTVTVPVRFAEVQARLASGQTTRLAEPRKFLGWRGYGPNPALLFDGGDRRVVVDTGEAQDLPTRKFITPDGGLLELQA